MVKQFELLVRQVYFLLLSLLMDVDDLAAPVDAEPGCDNMRRNVTVSAFSLSCPSCGRMHRWTADELLLRLPEV